MPSNLAYNPVHLPVPVLQAHLHDSPPRAAYASLPPLFPSYPGLGGTTLRLWALTAVAPLAAHILLYVSACVFPFIDPPGGGSFVKASLYTTWSAGSTVWIFATLAQVLAALARRWLVREGYGPALRALNAAARAGIIGEGAWVVLGLVASCVFWEIKTSERVRMLDPLHAVLVGVFGRVLFLHYAPSRHSSVWLW